MMTQGTGIDKRAEDRMTMKREAEGEITPEDASGGGNGSVTMAGADGRDDEGQQGQAEEGNEKTGDEKTSETKQRTTRGRKKRHWGGKNKGSNKRVMKRFNKKGQRQGRNEKKKGHEHRKGSGGGSGGERVLKEKEESRGVKRSGI